MTTVAVSPGPVQATDERRALWTVASRTAIPRNPSWKVGYGSCGSPAIAR